MEHELRKVGTSDLVSRQRRLVQRTFELAVSLLRQIAARQSLFFAREARSSSGIVDLLTGATIVLRLKTQKNPEECAVIPIGYVLLGICLRGPQFKEMVAANLAVFASASARRGPRNLNSLPR